MHDLEPASRQTARVVEGIRDEQLGLPTPCAGTTVGDLIDHVDGLSLAFAAAAAKDQLPGGSRPPTADASRLGPEWRSRVPSRLAALAEAWRDPAAWQGDTEAGGQPLPSALAGVIALDEVIVHGWDLAVSTGQPYASSESDVEAALGFVRETVARNPQGTPGLFGPPVSVPDDAPPLDRLIGLTGRDPKWSSTRVGG